MAVQQNAQGLAELTLSLEQAKRVYTALFCRIQTGGCTSFADLDQDDLLLELQSYLQKRAAEQGVDCTDHAAWEAFLGITHPASCPKRTDDAPRQKESDG